MTRSGLRRAIPYTLVLSLWAIAACSGDDDITLGDDDDDVSSSSSSGRSSTSSGSTSSGGSGTTTSSGSSGTTTSSSSGGSSSGETLPNTDIRDVQNGTVATESVVKIDGVVTAVDPNANFFFVQEPDGEPAYSGIAVRLGGANTPFQKPSVGDMVTVQGKVTEWKRNDSATISRTNIDTPDAFSIDSNGNPLPQPALIADPATLMAADTGEPYEGVLVRVEDVSVTSATSEFEFVVSGGLVVADRLFDFADPAVDDFYNSLTGVIDHDRESYRLFPRSEDDMEVGLAPLKLVSLTPTHQRSVVGTSRTYTVTLNRAVDADTELTLASDTPAVASPTTATVTVPAGASSATFEVQALAVAAAPAVISVALANSQPPTISANLIVVDPPTDAFAMSEIAVYGNIGGAVDAAERTGVATVTLAAPAPAGGYQILFESDDDALLAVPEEIVVPEGKTTATFRVRAGAQIATAVDVYAVGADGDLYFTVEILAVAPAPTVDGKELVINEIAHNPKNLDSDCNGKLDSSGDEFVELVNISDHPIQLNGVALWDKTTYDAAANNALLRFGERALGPGEALVVFPKEAVAGNAPVEASPWCTTPYPATATTIGDASFVRAAGSLSINDTNERMVLTVANKATILDEFSWTTNTASEQSFERNPQLSPVTAFIKHTSYPGASAHKLTPGSLATGAPFAMFKP